MKKILRFRGLGAIPTGVRLLRALSAELLLTAGLPTEFRLFAAGRNETENGYAVLFDERAAELVMANQRDRGVDMPIDLEHQTFESQLRSDMSDARGYFRLEVRDGELWATGVTWTPDGERRLKERTQRYTSPAFDVEEIEGSEGKLVRVTRILNVALTALPATHNAMPLVASLQLSGGSMPPEVLKKALEALQEQNGDSALEILQAMVVAAASGESAEAPAEEAPAEGAALEGAADAPPEEEEQPAAASAAPAAPAKASADADSAMIRALLAATGQPNVLALTEHIKTLTATQASVDKQTADIELSTRQTYIAQLVRLGAELPATAWEGDPEQRIPAAHLAALPIDVLRQRVVAFASARRPPAVVPARTRSTESSTRRQLSTAELKKIKELGLTQDEFWERVDGAVVRQTH